MRPHVAVQLMLLQMLQQGAALAVHDAVSTWIPPEIVRVKWPNDVLVSGRKISGILLESASTPEAPNLPWLAVGIGINLVSAPAVANYPATCVNDHAKAPDALEALSVLARAWDRRFRAWQQAGFEPISAHPNDLRPPKIMGLWVDFENLVFDPISHPEGRAKEQFVYPGLRGRLCRLALRVAPWLVCGEITIVARPRS